MREVELHSIYHDSTSAVKPLVLEPLYYGSSSGILLIPGKAHYIWIIKWEFEHLNTVAVMQAGKAQLTFDNLHICWWLICSYLVFWLFRCGPKTQCCTSVHQKDTLWPEISVHVERGYLCMKSTLKCCVVVVMYFSLNTLPFLFN